MIIAGLTGGIGHGKTTLATLLANHSTNTLHFESWELVAEVATALRNDTSVHPPAKNIDEINTWLYILPDIVAQTLHANCTFEDVKLTPERIASKPENYTKLFEYLDLMAERPELATVEITAENKETLRPLLQWLGGYLVARLGGVWYDEIIRRIQHLRGSSFTLVTVGGVRFPSDAESLRNAGGIILEIQRPLFAMQDKNDLTERDRMKIEPDSVVLNDGSLEDLTVCAKRVYQDLQLRQLKPAYTTVKA